MANLYTDYNGSSKTISSLAAQTLTFTGSDIPGAGVVAYHLYMTGASCVLANLTRIRLKANSQTIFDFQLPHFRTFLERISRANFAYATSSARLTIPLYLPDAKGDDRFVSQFPGNAVPTIEVVTNASVQAGTILAGWTRCDMKPTLFPKFMGYVLNVGASTTNFTVPISNDGEVRALVVNTTGLSRLKFVLDDVVRFQVDGTFALDVQQLENPVTISDPLAWKLHGTQPAPPGRSYFNIDTNGSWAGAANEAFLWSFHPQDKAA